MNMRLVTSLLTVLGSLIWLPVFASVPLVVSGDEVYIKAELSLQPISGNSKSPGEFADYSALLTGLQSAVRNNPREITDFFSGMDGSKELARGQLQDMGLEAFDLYRLFEAFEFTYQIKWGSYISLGIDFNIPNHGEFKWREDFHCEQDCLMSTSLSAAPENQIFEVAYLKLVESGVLDNLKASNREQVEIPIYPHQDNPAGTTSGDPILLSVSADKFDHSLCIRCDDDEKEQTSADGETPVKRPAEINAIENALIKTASQYDQKGFEQVLADARKRDPKLPESHAMPSIRQQGNGLAIVYVDFPVYLQKLLGSQELVVRGVIRSGDFHYAFLEKKGEALLDNESAFEVVLFKSVGGGELVPWFNTTYDYSDNIVFDSRVLTEIVALVTRE